MSEEAITSRRVPAPVVWHPRAPASPRRHARGTPGLPDKRGVVPGVAICLAVLFLVELHIRAITVPAAVTSETQRAVHAWLRR